MSQSGCKGTAPTSCKVTPPPPPIPLSPRPSPPAHPACAVVIMMSNIPCCVDAERRRDGQKGPPSSQRERTRTCAMQDPSDSLKLYKVRIVFLLLFFFFFFSFFIYIFLTWVKMNECISFVLASLFLLFQTHTVCVNINQ